MRLAAFNNTYLWTLFVFFDAIHLIIILIIMLVAGKNQNRKILNYCH